jgi:DNA-directed RNA polymerase alpha subunit
MNDETKEKLLDFFAIEALKTLIVKRDNDSRDAYRLAGDAYIIAERMLEHRQKVFARWKQPEEVEQDSIEQLNLTRRSERGLKAEGILTIQRLQLYTERRLMQIPNLGRKSITEIIEQMAALGYNLKDYA